jgi:hypothetical protein
MRSIRLQVPFLAALAAIFPVFAAQTGEISFELVTGASGVQVEKAFEGAPDADGVLKQYTVRVPRFEVATYFAAFQRHDPAGG